MAAAVAAPHCAAADKYARDVAAGRIPACRYVVAACNRHIEDLKRQKLAAWLYRFDKPRAERACRFIELLPHTKGEFARDPKNTIRLQPWQCFIVCSLFGWLRKADGARRFREAYIEVPRKNGKALSVDTPVATPDGWKLHGDLQAGDLVYGPGNSPIKVQAVTEHYSGPCMTVGFSDGTEIVAHERHEWPTFRTWYTKRRHGSRGALPLVETAEIAATLRGGARGDLVHSVASPGLLGAKAALPIPPYTFGAWLGDGDSNIGAITSADKEVIDAIAADGMPVRALRGTLRYSFSPGQGRPGAIRPILRSLGVLKNKHIPLVYMRASVEQRREVLAGLIDTDGHVTAAGQCELTLTSQKLSADAVDLIRSLGHKVSVTESRARLNGRDIGPRWRIQFWPASPRLPLRIPRKAVRLRGREPTRRRMITRCDPAGLRTVNCIQVEGGLYLAGAGLVPTHNSLTAAGIGLYLFAADGEVGAEVYSGATTEKQAWEVFKPARLMTLARPDLRQHYGIEVGAKNLNILGTASKFEPLIGKPGDGASPSCAIIDEFHEHETPDQYDTMLTGMGARRQPLMFIITTAGDNLAGPCYDKRASIIRVLTGQMVDEEKFGLIYGLDDGDDWTSEDVLAKANPNIDVSVSREFLLSRQREGIENARRQGVFKTKHLNSWVSARHALFNMQRWADCYDPTLRIEDFAGRRCILSLDLASKIDIAALAILFPEDDGRCAAFGRYYLPEETINSAGNDHYRGWLAAGKLIATDGSMIDFDRIEEDIVDLAKQFDVTEVAYDPFQATMLVTHLMNAGIPVIEFRQTVQNMSDPTKTLDGLVIAKKLRHACGPNDPMTWMMSNVTGKVDAKDNVYPRKERLENKIDGPVALVAAIGRMLAVPQNQGGTYLSEGPLLVL